MTLKHHSFLMSPIITDYTGYRHNLLSVKLSIQVFALVILNQIIRPKRDSIASPTSNRLKYSMHCATKAND